MKNILINMVGMSPAVLTEAIWALHEEGVILTEVVAVTTSEGKKQIESKLFGTTKIIEKLRKSLPKEYSDFKFNNTSKYIHTLSNADDSGESTDIQQTDDTIPIGDEILTILRPYQKSDTKLYFSIAGGRKSMTAMGALCMSLIGREQDELCHVLVNDKLVFSQPPFFFPTKTTHSYTDRGAGTSEELDGSTAKITLSRIPYVRMRNLFHDKFGHNPEYYTELVEQANKTVKGAQKTTLTIDVKHEQVSINGQTIELTEQRLAVLLTMASTNNAMTKEQLEDNAYELKDNFSPGMKHQLQQLNAASIKRVVSELKNNYFKAHDIFISRRAHYGLNFDKVEVKITPHSKVSDLRGTKQPHEHSRTFEL